MLSHVIPYCYSDKVGSIKLQFTRKSRLISQLSANIPASEKRVYFFYNPAINFHIAQKSVRKMPVLICWQCFVFFRCTLQNLTRKKACRSQEKKQIVLNVTGSRKLENKGLFCSLKKNSTMKDRMCKVWTTVFSSPTGIFLSFERLVYFTVY